MSHILGIDFSSRQVDMVLLDDDTLHAQYIPAPFVNHKPPFQFDDTRDVREAVNEAVWRAQHPGMVRLDVPDGWESIHLVGLEDSTYRSILTVKALSRVQGAILATIPRGVRVVPLTSHEWKRATVGKAMASKDDVRRWANSQAQVLTPNFAHLDWPQDAFDAYCIARAARALNQRAIESAA